MRVENHLNYKLVFSVSKHNYLGVIVEPYVIAYTPIKTLSLTKQKVFSGNASYYTKLSQFELDLIALLDPIMVENIVKKFSPVKKIRPKEYFTKHFKSETYKKQIRPFIEQHIAKLLSKLSPDFDALYLADDINPAAEQIKITSDFTKILFHFRRNENGTAYFITLKHNEEKVLFMKQYGFLLSNKPAFVLVNRKLYRFYDFVDGNKLNVFRDKKFIHIKPENERKYYETYIKGLLETSPVFAQGFDINFKQEMATPVLCIAKSISGEFGFLLKFKYGDKLYAYSSKKLFHVDLVWRNNNPTFTKYKRSIQWEENKLTALLALDLQESSWAHMISGDGSLQSAIHWLQTYKSQLDDAGYEINSELNEEYIYTKPKLTYNIADKLDWFDVNITITIDGIDISFKKIVAEIKRGNNQLVLENGKIFLFPPEWLSLGKALANSKATANGYEIKKYQLDILNHIASKKIKQHLNNIIDIKEEAPSKNFVGTLRKYQIHGLSWLIFLYRNKFGGILADDMGLGKTVQTLAFLQKVIENKESDNPCLLIAPTSLLYNWKNEITQFTPNLNILIHSGSRRAKSPNQLTFGTDLIITSYGLIRNDFELFDQMEFNVIVLDESQNIKNTSSKTTQMANKLRAVCRIALTGTPIENTVRDLWSQMNFLNKGLLGSLKSFVDKYAKPIEKNADKDKAKELTKLIKPFLLRRTKDEVAKELQPITEKVILCEMDPKQEKLYEKVKSEYRNSLLNLVEEKGINKSRLSILQGLSKLRQIANHPQLVEQEYTGLSGKHQTLLTHIKTALDEGHRVLVFSQYVKYLGIIENDLASHNTPYFLLTGSTDKERRADYVDRFQNGERPVFLISLKAGGTGLNLTTADYVFIVDPWWNPAAESQARDRTHRIGQTNNVFSYKFISKGTVEEKIVQLQKRKQSFAQDIIVTENNVLSNLDVKELNHLFT